MKTALLALLFSGCVGVSHASAAPMFVTSGSASVGAVTGGPFTLIGDDFALKGHMYQGLRGSIFGVPGDTLQIYTFSSGGDVSGGPGIFGGISYPYLFYEGFLQFAGSILVPDAPPDQVSVMTGFQFTSSLLGCTRDTFSGCPSGNLVFDADFIGAGTATVLLTSFLDSEGIRVYEISNVTFDFAPVPEPGAIVLLGTGLAALSTAVLRKRRTASSDSAERD